MWQVHIFYLASGYLILLVRWHDGLEISVKAWCYNIVLTMQHNTHQLLQLEMFTTNFKQHVLLTTGFPTAKMQTFAKQNLFKQRCNLYFLISSKSEHLLCNAVYKNSMTLCIWFGQAVLRILQPVRQIICKFALSAIQNFSLKFKHFYHNCLDSRGIHRACVTHTLNNLHTKVIT